MANWTVSSYSNAETQGDNVNAGSMATYADLTITPHTGYIIDKTNFKIGNATESPTNTWTGGNVDSEVYKVEFINDPADDSKVGTVDNKVTARVYWDSTALGGTPWSMPGNNDTIYIDIDEKVTIANVDRYFCLLSKHNASQNSNSINKHTVTYATAPTDITITNQTPLVHNLGTGLVSHHVSGTVPEGVQTLIYQVTFATNTTYGYYYGIYPSAQINAGAYSSYYSIVTDNAVTDTDGHLTSIRFNVYYLAPAGTSDGNYGRNASSMCELGQEIVFNHVIKQKELGEPGSVKQVTAVTVDTSNIDPNGETRNIDIFGDGGTFVNGVYQDAAQCTFEIVSSDASKTYDFGPQGGGANGTFTAAATNSGNITFGQGSGNPMFACEFPSVSVNRTYDIIVTPTPPTTAAPGVPVAANQLRLYQYVDAVVTLGLLDGAGSAYTDADLLDGDPNTAITITGPAEQQGATHTREFSYKIMPAMLTSGSTLTVKAAPDFSLDTGFDLDVTVSGNPSGTTVNIGSGTDLQDVAQVGMEINWTIQKRSTFDGENVTEIPVSNYVEDGDLELEVNTDNVIEGMLLTTSRITERDNITVESVVADSHVVLSRAVEMRANEILTFTSQNISISSITDADTFVASTDMTGVKDGLAIEIGGGVSDVVAWVDKASATKVSNDVFITGTFNVSSFPQGNLTAKLDLNKIITVS